MMRNKGPSLLIPVLFLAMLVLVGSALGQNADSFFPCASVRMPRI